MTRRLVLVTLLFTSLIVHLPVYSSSAQTPDEQTPPTPAETPPTTPAEPPSPAPHQDEHALPELSPQEREDPVMILGELRGSVRSSPDTAENRLKLADALYRIGDIESALDEYRVAIRLRPDIAQAHLHLAVALMAKQDWRTALTELNEAVRLQPTLVQAHYNMGTIQYTLGNLKAAIQSYHEALRLQPYFPDAHYHLALVLKLANREKEAVQEMEIAAQGGVAKAHYFLGNAYRSGQGTEKNIAMAIASWVRAAEHGVTQAFEALGQLRQASHKGSRNKDAQAAAQALRDYRSNLWREFPDVTRADEAESIGAALVKVSRAEDAVPVLIREAYVSPETARPILETLYEHGVEGQLPPFDPRILRFFETAAAAGLPGSRVMLAQIYARGLGVPQDAEKAKTLLKGFAKGQGSQTKRN